MTEVFHADMSGDDLHPPGAHNHNASDVNAGTLAAARLPAATTTAQGAVELATQAEVNTGTDAVRVVTPDTLANYTGLGSGGTAATTDFDPFGTIAATNVQDAIEELFAETPGTPLLAEDIEFDPVGTIAATDVQAAIAEVASEAGGSTPDATETTKGKAEIATQAETNTGTDDTRIVTPLKLKTNVDLHIDDASGAHAASAISIADSAAQYTATNAEDALAEVLDALQAHEVDASGAHAASAISFSPTGTVAATTVQAAIAEVASEAGGGGGTLPCPITVIYLDFQNTGFAWTNMPAALTEITVAEAKSRTWCDLTNASEMRIIVGRTGTASATGAELRVQYSTDESSWSYVDGSSGPARNIETTTGTLKGSWATIDAGAKQDVVLRVIGINGNGTADPLISNVIVQVK